MGVNIKALERTMIAKPRGNGARGWNGKAAPTFKTSRRRLRASKMVTELWGDEEYKFYPLGKYIVADPEICRGRPTFKYTRIDAFYALDLLAAGWTIKRIADEWWGNKVPAEAIQEVLQLAEKAWFDSLAALGGAQ